MTTIFEILPGASRELRQLYLGAQVDLIEDGRKPRIVDLGAFACNEAAKLADLNHAQLTGKECQAQLVQAVEQGAAAADRAPVPGERVFGDLLERE